MKDFKSTETIERIQQFVDKFARKAWEPFYNDEPNFPKNSPARPQYFDHKGNQVGYLWEVLEKSTSSFRGAIMSNANLLAREPAHQKPPHGFDIAENGSGWLQFEHEKIIEIITSSAVVSVADAMVKTTGYLQTIAGSMSHGNKRYLFRGQSNISHSLIPRLGRILDAEISAGKFNPPSDPFKVTQRELDELHSFQSAWVGLPKDDLDDFIVNSYSPEDSGWWVLMQHFADSFGNGTRMLDVTSSLLFALLFACVKWDTGEIDSTTDGVIYLFVEGQNCAVRDYLDKEPPKEDEFFSERHDIKYMIFNPPHNERSKAQSGGFIWWPKFWEPMQDGLPYLRIPKENKLGIAKELLAFGVGPKEAVRGQKGIQNEKVLRSIVARS